MCIYPILCIILMAKFSHKMKPKIFSYVRISPLVYQVSEKMIVMNHPRGHGGRVVTLLPLTSEIRVRFLAQPQV